MRRRKRYGHTHVPTSDEEIDRLIDLLEEGPDPVGDLPEMEPIESLVRSMSAEMRGRFQAGALL